MGGQGVGGKLPARGAPGGCFDGVWRLPSHKMLCGAGLTCGPGPMGPIPRGGFILCMGPPMLGCPVGRKVGVLHDTAVTLGPKLTVDEKKLMFNPPPLGLPCCRVGSIELGSNGCVPGTAPGGCENKGRKI